MRVLLLVLAIGSGRSLAQVEVSLPKLSTQLGSSLRIPLNVGDLTGKNVTSFEFVLSCDSNIVRLSGVDQKGTLSTGLTMFANNRVRPFGPGKMKVVCASALPISGRGVLVFLTGSVQKRIGRCSLKISDFLFNTGSPTVNISDGAVRAVASEKSKTTSAPDSVAYKM